MKQRDFEKIKALFDSAYHEEHVMSPLDKYEDKKDMMASNYMVYSFSALPVLIEKMKRVSNFDFSQKYSVRFTIDQDRNCWFAFEGRPGDMIEYTDSRLRRESPEQAPAHSDMTSTRTSISAGIIVFSDDYQITRITNFSGHYRPSAGSLVWIIASLIQLNANFTPDVALSFYWKKKRELKSKHVSLPRENLHTLLPSDCTISPTTDYKIIVYTHGKSRHFGPDEEANFEVLPQKRHRFRRPGSGDMDVFSIFGRDESIIPTSPMTKKGIAIDFTAITASFVIEDTKLTSSSTISAVTPPSSPLPKAASAMHAFFPASLSTPPPSTPEKKQSQVTDIEPFSDNEDDGQLSPKNA